MAAPSERAPLLGHRKAAPTPARARRGELAAALLLVAALLYSSFSFASPGDERRPFSVKGSTEMGFMILSVDDCAVRKVANVNLLHVKAFGLEAVAAINAQRRECKRPAHEIAPEEVEVFHAWESAETGELVAVAAELGSNQLVGMLRDTEDERYRAFNVRSQGLPDLDVCKLALTLGGEVDVNALAAAAPAAEFFVAELNAACALEPPVSGARVAAATTRAVAGLIWTLDLQLAKQRVESVEVWQMPGGGLALTDTARATAVGLCGPIRSARASGEDLEGGVADEDDGLAFPSRARRAETQRYPDGFADHSVHGGTFPPEQVSKFGELSFGEFGGPADYRPAGSHDLRAVGPNCVSGNRVRNQGQCGSCWSFATNTAWANQICLRSDDPAYRADQSSCNQCAGAVAAVHPPCAGKGASDELDDQKLYTCPGALSTQYQLDCNKKADNCHGGTLQEAWKFTMTTGGVSEASYRYGQYSSADNTAQTVAFASAWSMAELNEQGKNFYPAAEVEATTKTTCPGTKTTSCTRRAGERTEGNVCSDIKYDLTEAKTKCGSRRKLRTDKQIMYAVEHIGPVTVGIMTYGSFYDYDDGIYQPEPGEEEKGGHAVQVVGWGSTEDGVDYWTMENSWGADWGETKDNAPCAGKGDCGYFRHIRGDLFSSPSSCNGADQPSAEECWTTSFSNARRNAEGGLVATVYQKTFLMDGYVAKDCGADYDGATGKGTAGDCTACLESTVTGGSAARMLAVEDDVTRCTQEFEFRTANRVNGRLVLQSPVDVGPDGLAYGNEGVMIPSPFDQAPAEGDWKIEPALSARGRVHSITATLLSTPDAYRFLFYPMMADGSAAVGDPFEFELVVNCQGIILTPPTYSSIAVPLVAASAGIVVCFIIGFCYYRRHHIAEGATEVPVVRQDKHGNVTSELYEKDLHAHKEEISGACTSGRRRGHGGGKDPSKGYVEKQHAKRKAHAEDLKRKEASPGTTARLSADRALVGV